MEERRRLLWYCPANDRVPVAEVRDFLFPGFIHCIKNSFTRYQLVIDLLRKNAEQGEEAAEQSEPRLRRESERLGETTVEASRSCERRAESFIRLVNSIYTPQEKLRKRYELSSERKSEKGGLYRDEDSGDEAEVMAAILRTSAGFAGAEMRDFSAIYGLSGAYCVRLFGSIGFALYTMVRRCGAKSVRIGTELAEGEKTLVLSSEIRDEEASEGCAGEFELDNELYENPPVWMSFLRSGPRLRIELRPL